MKSRDRHTTDINSTHGKEKKDRQTDGQTDRRTDRETNIQRDRKKIQASELLSKKIDN